MSSLLERMQKSGAIKASQVLSKSKFFNVKDQVPTDIPIINAALSGRMNGGLTSGLTFLAGPSKSFKSLLGLLMLKGYMKKYPDSICLFYDSEFGITPDYISANGIDTNRVLHIPIEHLEQLKFDISKRLEEITRGDKVFIFIDSVGNLASKKEVEDALEGNSAADMSRAKVMKSLWRIVTPHLTTKDIPCVAINHTYVEQKMYGSTIMSGGCLLAGTKIQMSDDTVKSIEDITVGESVKTLLGDKLVKHTWNPDTLAVGTPECYEILFSDDTIVQCSDVHKFLVGGGWVEAKDLMCGINVQMLSGSTVYPKRITLIGKNPVYDITVEDAEHYVLENGVVTHNTGGMYSANQVFIIGKSQEKDGTDLIGYNFTINIEKSRYVKEKSKFCFTVYFDGGISKWSGLMDLALESGHVVKPSNGWYSKVNSETGEVDPKKVRLKDTDNKDFWMSILMDKSFNKFISDKYQIAQSALVQDDGHEIVDNEVDNEPEVDDNEDSEDYSE